MRTGVFYTNSILLLRRLIAIPSYSREEKEAADALETYMKENHLSPCRKGNNIWAFSPGWDERKKTILLNSHIDTVKPVSGWGDRDPFSPETVGDQLFGLGSNDAGASLVSLLSAFQYLITTEQSNNFIFLASCEEEISGKNGIESVLPELPPIDFAVVGEPTRMQPAVAERGLMVLDAVVRGRSGHAARDEGENAIYKAIPSIRWFEETRFLLESEWLGAVKMTVTQIEAGTQHNVIPDECRFTVDVRSNDCYSNETLFEWIAHHCGCEVKARSFRLNASGISQEHPFVQRAMQSGLIPFGSPSLSDQALMPFPSVKIGPGDSSRSHTAGEYVLQSEIKEAIDLYIRLLQLLNLT
jgi:acetylornithine deacetylase